jgi:mRNA interferase RelE/StbE
MFEIVLEWSAWRELQALSNEIQSRILDHLDDLARDPRPHCARALQGGTPRFRIRIGAYRVVYRVDDEHEQVIILAVGHRRGVY